MTRRNDRYLKRLDGSKDYGNMLGAHGGFMDRFDGVILTMSAATIMRRSQALLF